MDGCDDEPDRSGQIRQGHDTESHNSFRRAEIDERIATFSIRALDYDPASDGHKPRDILDWARRQQELQARRRKALGMLVTGIGTAIAGGAAWPLVQRIIPWLGH